MLRLPSFTESLEVARGWGHNSYAPHLWNGLVADWNFLQGGGSTLYDIAGGNHGTLTNMDPSTDWVMTENGWALKWAYGTGSVTRVEIPKDWTSELLASGYTFYCRIWLDTALLSRDALLLTATNTANGLGLNTRADRFVFTHKVDGVSTNASDEDVNALDKFYSLAATYDGTTVRFYLDGDLKSGTNSGDALSGRKDQYTVIGGEFLQGNIPNAAIWNRALQPSEIQQLYDDPHAMHRRRPTVVPFIDAAPPASAIMNQIQFRNLGSDLFNGTLIP